MNIATHTRPLFITLAALAVAVVFMSRPALATSDLSGRWSGTFEFVVVSGESASFGPAATLEGNKHGESDKAPTFGEGDLTVTIENQLGDHFFGRWSAGGRNSDIVCTMIDDTHFLCGGKEANVIGKVVAGDSLRMCWSVSGKSATSGCADLTRPR